MIPAPLHFQSIYREAWLHPDVEIEIEAARSRTETPARKRRNILVALLHPIERRRPARNRVRVPAE